MIYHVRARLRREHADELHRRLTDGSIAQQRPDGAEIVASMNRAVVAANGSIEWSEECYCASPLHHERSTVLDRHFEDITTESIDAHGTYEGQPFMTYLRDNFVESGNER